MGLTKDFFTKPIRVTFTFQDTEGEKHQVVFTFNRETVAQADAQTVAGSIFSHGDNFERFCNLLACEPEGIDDFPSDSGRPLRERAKDYFADPAYQEIVTLALVEVERSQKPLEFFQRF